MAACAPKDDGQGAGSGGTESGTGTDTADGSGADGGGTHGGGTDGSGADGSDGSGGGGSGTTWCEDPQEVWLYEEDHVLGDHSAGYVRCEGEAFDRIEPVACVWDYQVMACNPDMEGGECATDEDCPGESQCRSGGGEGCVCTLVCQSDADCPADQACICAAGASAGGDDIWGLHSRNECMPAQCRGSADCDGLPCGVAEDDCGNLVGLFCRTAEDECYEATDCVDEDPEEEYCGYDQEAGHWTCKVKAAACE